MIECFKSGQLHAINDEVTGILYPDPSGKTFSRQNQGARSRRELMQTSAERLGSCEARCRRAPCPTERVLFSFRRCAQKLSPRPDMRPTTRHAPYTRNYSRSYERKQLWQGSREVQGAAKRQARQIKTKRTINRRHQA